MLGLVNATACVKTGWLGLGLTTLDGFLLSSYLVIPTPNLYQDLEQESQRRALEVETLEQQLSKAAADAWLKMVKGVHTDKAFAETWISSTLRNIFDHVALYATLGCI